MDVPLQFGISIQKVAQQAMNEDDQQIFEVIWQEGGELCIASWTTWEAERLCRFGKKVSRLGS